MKVASNIRTFWQPVKSKIKQLSVVKLSTRVTFMIYMSFISLTTYCYCAISYPERVTLSISKTAEKVSEIPIPKFMRKKLFRAYSRYYKVKLNEIVEPLDSFKTFGEFFTRKIHPRVVDDRKSMIVCPADSKILKISEITTDQCQIIKGASYSLGQLYVGQSIKFTDQQIQSLKTNPDNKLYQIIYYLAPGDYHRFHSPADFKVTFSRYISGALFGVSESTLKKRGKVYEKNTRHCLHGEWHQGRMSMIMVGALNVGRIIIKQQQNFKKGDEIGYFNLGSTIVMVFEAKGVKQWIKNEKEKVLYGEPVCQVEI